MDERTEIAVDEALDKVGGYRRWHLTAYVLLTISTYLPHTMQGIAIVFIGWEPPHHCMVTNEEINSSIPYTIKNGMAVLDSCNMYVNISVDNATMPCSNGWEYQNDGYTTIVTEFQLFCGQDYFAELSQTIYRFGSTFLEVFTSYFIDRFGRKKLHVVTHMLVGCIGIAESFSPNYITFVILRTLIGIISEVGINAGFTYLIEMFDSKRRTLAGIGTGFVWVGVYLLPCLIAWMVPNWRHYLLIAASLSFIWIIYVWFLPESVSWLASKKRYQSAEDALLFMAKMNGVSVTKEDVQICRSENARLQTTEPKAENPIIKQNVEDDPLEVGRGLRDNKSDGGSQEHKAVPISALFCDSKLRIHFLISNIIWFCNSLVYYGLVFASPTLGSNRFLNYTLYGLVEIPSIIVSLYVVSRYGRRISMMAFSLLAGIPLFCTAFVPKVTGSGVDMTAVILTLCLVAKFASAGSFAIMIVYIRELFPTNLRSSSIAWCSIGGGIGGMIAPFMAYTAKRIFWLPNILFSLAAVIGMLALIALPESLNKPLPLITEQVHAIYYSKVYEKTTKDVDNSVNPETHTI